jgi:hypothetical protein
LCNKNNHSGKTEWVKDLKLFKKVARWISDGTKISKIYSKSWPKTSVSHFYFGTESIFARSWLHVLSEIGLSSIAKHILATYVYHFRVIFLEPTGVVCSKLGRDPIRARTHDPWVYRQTPLSQGHRSLFMKWNIFTYLTEIKLVLCPSTVLEFIILSCFQINKSITWILTPWLIRIFKKYPSEIIMYFNSAK